LYIQTAETQKVRAEQMPDVTFTTPDIPAWAFVSLRKRGQRFLSEAK
jgi:hypothetical protein